MAQAMVSDVEGVTAIVNCIEVMTSIPRETVGREAAQH